MEYTNEIWRPVIGYEVDYEVSNVGRVRRISVSRGTRPGRLLNPVIGKRGYPFVAFRKPGELRKQLVVHRLVAAAFLSPDPTRKYINHKNGIKTDNRLENLERCTNQENTLHSYRVLGHIHPGLEGERNGGAKLLPNEVHAILDARRRGESLISISRRYPVSASMVRLICIGKSWKHIQGKR